MPFYYINDRFYPLAFVQGFFSFLQITSTLYLLRRFERMLQRNVHGDAEEAADEGPATDHRSGAFTSPQESAVSVPTEPDSRTGVKASIGTASLMKSWLLPQPSDARRIGAVHVVLGIALFKLCFNAFVETLCNKGTNRSRNAMFLLCDLVTAAVVCRLEWHGILAPAHRGHSLRVMLGIMASLWCAFMLGLAYNHQRVC